MKILVCTQANTIQREFYNASCHVNYNTGTAAVYVGDDKFSFSITHVKEEDGQLVIYIK